MYRKFFKTPEDSNYFFGYYDKSPICINDKKHLALRINFLDRLPKWGDIADIGFFDLEKLSGNDSFKAKITQLITGGSIDSISRNLKNYNLPDDKRDYKYSSFQYSEESKKMISKVKSHTREK